MPGGKCRLSCWLNVERLEPSSLPPYLKIGLTDQEGRWLTNFHTQTYDTARLGTWQHLEAVLETPLDTAQGHLALERGARTRRREFGSGSTTSTSSCWNRLENANIQRAKSLFSVQCSVFSVQCSVFSVQCSVFSVQCSGFSVRGSVFSVQGSGFSF